ncbi:putative POM121-like protein 1 [Phocoena sinus]|uniref:putative POM121-like protein 1 n=1 Tax=Phocoena sinus TaxID=42100 RepID=UPI0013C4922E|nr:putative POM121-like protein 1 [Phocoena sinus]
MGARTSTTSRSSVSAVDTVTVSVARGQPVPATTPSCVPNYSTEKTVFRALGERGQGMAKQEEVPTVTGRNDEQRSGPNDTGDARSAFSPLGGSFFVPRPGPLQRDLHAKRAEDRSARKQQTSCMSSCPRRNAITSSYSSTRGFLPVERRRGPAIPQGLPQKSAKTGGEEGPPSPSAAPLVYRRKSQPDKDAETARGQKGPWRTGSRTSDSPRPQKRRIPLLPHRRGEPLRLPPAPEPGFRVTAEDLDSEKQAAFRCINSALRGETYAIGDLGSSPQNRKPMCVDSPVFTPQNLPPVTSPTAPSPSLPITCTVSSRPSPGTSAGLAPQAASDPEVSPMDTTPPSHPLLLGSAPGSSGSLFSSTQARQTPPSDSTSSVTVTTSLLALRFCTQTLSPPLQPGATTQPISGAPDWQQRGTTACGSSPQHRKRKAPGFASAPGPPASGGPAQAASGGSPSTNSTVGTHASTQLGFGSRAAARDLSCMFAALNITTRKRGPPSTTHSNEGSVGLNSWGPPHQSQPMVTTGPSSMKNPRFGGTTASTLSHIPVGAPRQGPPTSSRGRSPCPAKADFRRVSVPASTPLSLSSAVGRARCSLAVRAPSSPAQGLAGQKTTGPSTKSFSSRSRFITLGFKRRKLA